MNWLSKTLAKWWVNTFEEYTDLVSHDLGQHEEEIRGIFNRLTNIERWRSKAIPNTQIDCLVCKHPTLARRMIGLRIRDEDGMINFVRCYTCGTIFKVNPATMTENPETLEEVKNESRNQDGTGIGSSDSVS
jgi:transcription elongation factor Elf1